MSYLFIDESGDLGFDFSKKKTSKHFVMACLIIHSEKDKKSVEKIVKKIFAGFSKQEIKTHPFGLHAFKEQTKTINRLLSSLVKKNVFLGMITLDKKKIGAFIKESSKQDLYNQITVFLLKKIIKKNIFLPHQKITLIASRRETNKSLNENFISFLKQKLTIDLSINIEFTIAPAQDEKCLQIIDCVCWSAYQFHEHEKATYKNMIEAKMIVDVHFDLNIKEPR